MSAIFRRHPRGRPPHPDVLTPAEWRVLEEVRDGRSNPEIAERLGVSRNTVKTHVSSILEKLELRDRNELAVWRGQPARAHRSPLLAPLAWLTARSEVLLMAVAAATVVASVIVATRSGVLTGSAPQGIATPVVTATELAAATPDIGLIPPCPVARDVCVLAVEFLPLVRAADGPAIAARATTQTLRCPAGMPTFEEVLASQIAAACQAAGVGADVDVYEWHNQKAPFYYTRRAESRRRCRTP